MTDNNANTENRISIRTGSFSSDEDEQMPDVEAVPENLNEGYSYVLDQIVKKEYILLEEEFGKKRKKRKGNWPGEHFSFMHEL